LDGCCSQLLFFFFIACIAYDPSKFEPAGREWPEYFAIPVLALVTITILNDGTLIAVAYDNVEATKLPEKWDLGNLYLVSSVIGFIAMLSSLLLLLMGLNSWEEDSVRTVDEPGLHDRAATRSS
jgi:H+-transporting ATPase